MTWSLRSWAIVLVVVVPLLALKAVFGLEYASWLQWLGIAFAGLAGIAVLISPDLTGMKSPVLARLLGAIAFAAASLGAYQQLTAISSE